MKDSEPQWASITLDMDDDVVVHCPICGQATMNREESAVTPCSHLVFIHVGIVDQFEYQSDDFARRMEGVGSEDDDEWDLRSVVGAAGYGNKLLALEIESSGMACGPIGSVDVFAFSFEQPM